VDERDDITSEWATLKSLPGVKAIAEDMEPSELVVGAYPEVIYKIIEESYGLRYMAVWRYKCFGQKRSNVYGGRMRDCWIVSYDIPLWKGEKADDRVHPIPNPRDFGRMHLSPKKDSYTSLADVTAAFIKARDKAIANYRSEISRWREDVARLQRQITDDEALIAKMETFVPKLV
jgi:hypothetical protein